MTDDAVLDRALIEEAAKKSALLWVRADEPQSVDRPWWYTWYDGAVTVVVDGDEQPAHGLRDGATATVTLRSKDTWGRLVAWPALVVELAPDDPRWDAAVHELRGKRLNAPDHDTIAERWRRESRILRLEPAGPTSQRPGAQPDISHAATPLPTTATTRRPVPAALPRLLFGRKRKRTSS